MFSPEILQKFNLFREMIVDWNRVVPLVSKGDIDNLWDRHFLDSAQLANLISQKDRVIFDIGSGAGFPGIVLSILGYRVILCDSHLKKIQFLTEVARQLNLNCEIICSRAEALSLSSVSFFTSRATTTLDNLLKIMNNVSRGTYVEGFFHKGRDVQFEIEHAKNKTDFDYTLYPSSINQDGCIIHVRTKKGLYIRLLIKREALEKQRLLLI